MVNFKLIEIDFFLFRFYFFFLKLKVRKNNNNTECCVRRRVNIYLRVASRATEKQTLRNIYKYFRFLFGHLITFTNVIIAEKCRYVYPCWRVLNVKSNNKKFNCVKLHEQVSYGASKGMSEWGRV